jgi:hypothetical protein
MVPHARCERALGVTLGGRYDTPMIQLLTDSGF